MNYDRTPYANDVFISYSSKQKKEAYLIRDILNAGGLSTWMAPESIPSGSDYTTEIPRAIEGCRVVVVVLSADAQASDWVTLELKSAIRLRKDIVPFAFKNVKLEDAFDTMLSRYQRINAYHRLFDALEELVQSVNRHIEKQSGTPDEAYMKARLKQYRRSSVILSAAAVIAAIGLLIGMSFIINNIVNTARENAAVTKGVIGECQWNYDPEAGELTIYGDGAASDDAIRSVVPWSRYIGEIRTLTVKEGVTAIPNNAMSGAKRLTEVTLPRSLKTIGGMAFDNCAALKSIEIPDQVTSIGLGAFEYCTSLQSIRIPASVTELGDAGVSTVSFTYSGMKTIEVDEKNERYASLDGCLYNKKRTKLLFYPPKRSSRRFEIPQGVTEIGPEAFSSCLNLVSVSIPDTVTHIDASAFSGCFKLGAITLPDGLVEIGDKAFYLCSALRSVTMGNNVKAIGSSAFSNCSDLTTINLSGKLRKISEAMFQSCPSLSLLYIPDGIESIDKNAFRYCSGLNGIRIPPTVTKIDSAAFDSGIELFVMGAEDSYAQRFAKENGFTFSAE